GERGMSLLETNIDDMNPEFYAAVAEKLFANGARDVWWRAIQMKKNRPAVTLSVLAMPEYEARLATLLLRETTTLGMRVHRIGRYEAARRMEEVETPFGSIAIKLKILEGEVIGAVPEFEACKAAAQAYGVATRQVYEAAAACAWHTFLMALPTARATARDCPYH
ncbi:MAG: nickel insertion protein, partial [Ardenticatenaceae bacterium]